MKQCIFIATLLISIISCSKFDEGGDNACQFVKEQLSLDFENVESIEPTAIFEVAIINISERNEDIMKKYKEEKDGIISKEDLVSFYNRLNNEVEAANDSWSGLQEDKQKAIDAGVTAIRRVYNVAITMKSKKKTNVNVIMEDDKVTPYMLEKDYIDRLWEFQKEIKDNLEMENFSLEINKEIDDISDEEIIIQ